VEGERVGLDETRVGVFGGKASDRAGLLHGVAHRRAAQIGRAAGPVARAKIHGDAEPAIALVFDSVHFTQTHGHAEPLAHTRIGFTLRCSPTLGSLQHKAHDVLELWDFFFGSFWHARIVPAAAIAPAD